MAETRVSIDDREHIRDRIVTIYPSKHPMHTYMSWHNHIAFCMALDAVYCSAIQLREAGFNRASTRGIVFW